MSLGERDREKGCRMKGNRQQAIDFPESPEALSSNNVSVVNRNLDNSDA